MALQNIRPVHEFDRIQKLFSKNALNTHATKISDLSLFRLVSHVDLFLLSNNIFKLMEKFYEAMT